ncbi:MAG: hypothetical protein AB8B56_08020 [Crocinitomicaceae bacterium]
MKGVKQVFAFVTFLCIASISVGQSMEEISNELSIEVFDVVSREPLREYDLRIINEVDTLKMHIDSVENMKINLTDTNHYKVVVFKNGYDSVSVDFDNPIGSTKTFVHFYVPKLKLTRKEKRTANYHSRNLPPSIFDSSPCFDKVKINRTYMLTMRFFLKNSAYSESTLDMEKLRDY